MPEEEPAAAGTVRVMTWNIHGGIGATGLFALEPVVDVVRRHVPDIVAIQEIDSRGRGQGPDSPFEVLASAVGAHVQTAQTIVAEEGAYGHLLASRWALSNVKLHDLSRPRHEPRCVVESTVNTPQGALHVVAVHLGLRITERRAQALQLANIAAAGPETSVIMGDFNDWWRGDVRRALAAVLPDHSWLRSYPARCPLLRLDRIYCRPAGALVRTWTDWAARFFSDHLPIFADLRIDAGRNAQVPGGRSSPALPLAS